jgi:hypothetical protein
MGNSCSFHEVVPPVRRRSGERHDARASPQSHRDTLPGDTMRRAVSWQRADGSIRGVRVGHTLTIVGDTRRAKSRRSQSAPQSDMSGNPLGTMSLEHSGVLDETVSASHLNVTSFDAVERMSSSGSYFEADYIDGLEERPVVFEALQLPGRWAEQVRGGAKPTDSAAE